MRRRHLLHAVSAAGLSISTARLFAATTAPAAAPPADLGLEKPGGAGPGGAKAPQAPAGVRAGNRAGLSVVFCGLRWTEVTGQAVNDRSQRPLRKQP